jgi:predicted permease
MLTSLAASLYPALRLSRVDPNRALRAGGAAGTSRGQHRLRAGFVVTQIAVTLVLLVTSTLLIRLVTHYRHTELGFDPNCIMTTELDLLPARYEHRDMIADFYHPMLERVSRIPGIRAAGLINMLPIEDYGSNSQLHLTGQPPYPPNEDSTVEERMVSEGYYDVFGIPLRRGRRFSSSQDGMQNHAWTTVVNDAFVRRFVPGNLDPVGQHTDDTKSETGKAEDKSEIVGVTGNVRQNLYEEPMPQRDRLIDEVIPEKRAGWLGSMQLVVRFDGSSSALGPALRAAVHEIDPTVSFKQPRTMTDVVSEALVFERMEEWLFGIFSALALLLAVVGLYGLVSHEVAQSTREIGVRVAWMSASGAAAGVVCTVLARKLIGMVIEFNVQHMAWELAGLSLLLVVISLIAAVIPALLAASVEPVSALRAE